jgi:hypothetical protein
MKNLYAALQRYQINLQLFHLQTDDYGAHKASDQLYTAMTELIDELMEVYQGVHGTLGPVRKKIDLISQDKNAMATSTTRLLNRIKSAFKKCTDNSQCHIYEEMMAALSRFLYLLRLK